MSNMTSSQRSKCHAIIHSASASAGAVGAGLAQIPCSDNMIITPIQLTMTIALGRVFGIELTESAAKASLASSTSRPYSPLYTINCCSASPDKLSLHDKGGAFMFFLPTVLTGATLGGTLGGAIAGTSVATGTAIGTVAGTGTGIAVGLAEMEAEINHDYA